MKIHTLNLLLNKKGGSSGATEIYEFIIDTSNPDPYTAVSYTGSNSAYTPASYSGSTFSYGNWEDSFFIKGIRPVMVKSNGTVDYELNHDDFTKKLNGTASDISNTSYDGNCMIAFPQIWMKFVQDDSTHQHVYIANEQVDSNYHCYTHQRKDGTWLDEIYLMAFDCSNVSNKVRSLAGLTPLYNLSGETMRTYCQANGSTWDFMGYGELQMLQMLCILLTKSLDVRQTLGSGIFGQTVQPSKTTGQLKNKGMFYATSFGETANSNPIKVFGIENLWGNYRKWINGLVIPKLSSSSDTRKVIYKLCDYTTDGTTTTSYNTSGAGYKLLEQNTANKAGYLSKLKLTSDGMFISSEGMSGGSITTYYGTYEYLYGDTSYDYVAFFGGGWNNNVTIIGIFFVGLNNRLAISTNGSSCSLVSK